jgi:hypothetical protein
MVLLYPRVFADRDSQHLYSINAANMARMRK